MTTAKEWYRTRKRRFTALVQRHMILRILIADKLFVACASFCFFATLFGLGMMVKLWKATPPHVVKEVKISGLDFLQARSLRSTAQAEELKGNFAKAAVAWELARANNPGNLIPSRSLLRLNQKQPGIFTQPRLLVEAYSLLHFSRTNVADLELVSESLLHLELYQDLVQLLAPIPQLLTQNLQSYLLRCRFHLRQMHEFERLWISLPKSDASNEIVNLYSMAFQAGWKQDRTREESWKSLQELASHKSGNQILANRLLSLVAYQRTDSYWAEIAWQHLRENSPTAFKEALLLLQVLSLEGNKSKILELLDQGALTPSNSREVLESANFCAEIGNSKHEALALEWGSKYFPLDPALGIRRSHQLISQKRWEELALMSVDFRSGHRGILPLRAFGRYLEARAMHGLGREETASKLAEELGLMNADTSRFAIEIANGLTAMGFPKHALNILVRAEPSWTKSLQYWTSLAVTANAARDESLLLRAAQNSYELNPSSLTSINNLAGAMLIQRTNAAESLKLTTRLFREHPNHVAVRINHATALLINHRPQEAAPILSSVDSTKLTRKEYEQLKLATLDLHRQQEMPALALQISADIERGLLFPSQIRWLNMQLTQIQLSLTQQARVNP